MRKTDADSTKEKKVRKSTVKSRNVQNTGKSVKSKLPSKTNSSNNRKPVICKKCSIEFADISKRNAHHCNGESRYYVCDHCGSKFKIKENFVVHRQTKHSTEVVVRKKVGMNSKKESHHNGTLQMEVNANNQELGEFVIDALYLDNNQLNCRARNLECFVTNNAFEMKAHREKYHMLLEQRISFKKWRNLIPDSFLSGELSGNDAKMKYDGKVKSRDINVELKSFALKGDESTLKKESQSEAAIHKNFGVYLEKLKRRYAGV